MVGPTAQLVALCCHMNGRARGLDAGPFFPGNSTCQFCEYVHFLRHETLLDGSSRWQQVAATPDAWLEQEAVPGKKALVVWRAAGDHGTSPRMSAGFVGGGGRWLLTVVSAEGPRIWQASWEVGNQHADERRIWRVQYASVPGTAALPAPEVGSVDAVGIRLRETLSGMVAFADEHGLRSFASCFRKAIACLSSDAPFAEVYHKDLAPHGVLGLPAQRLLAACQAAWVYGGMGSWNDMSFDGEEQKRYERLSDELFALLNEGICAGANSSADEKT